jgi:hypothetical protein
MANLQLDALYDQKQREFATQNNGGSRFQLDFIDATNRAINEINRKADLSTRVSRVDDIDDTVALDAKYEDVLSDGISLHLMMGNRRPAKGAEQLVRVRQLRFEDGISEIQADIRNIATDADSDDDSVTNIGLGPIG